MIVLCRAKLTLPQSLTIPHLEAKVKKAPDVKKENIFELLLHKNEPVFQHPRKKGVPMGIGLAPLLAVMVLQDAVEREKFLEVIKGRILVYADDGLIA
jgi:hypothetical protein